MSAYAYSNALAGEGTHGAAVDDTLTGGTGFDITGTASSLFAGTAAGEHGIQVACLNDAYGATTLYGPARTLQFTSGGAWTLDPLVNPTTTVTATATATVTATVTATPTDVPTIAITNTAYVNQPLPTDEAGQLVVAGVDDGNNLLSYGFAVLVFLSAAAFVLGWRRR